MSIFMWMCMWMLKDVNVDDDDVCVYLCGC